MRALALSLALVLAACGQSAPPPPAEAAPGANITVSDAWANPTPGGVDAAAGYLTIINHGAEGDTLIGVTSPRAAHVATHQMTMNGAVMSMAPMEGGLPLPARQTVTLAPGGLHLMFTDLTQPFAAGERVPVTLTFEHAAPVTISLEVRAP
ncbi:MAG: copper chaperone PCu(A)C [Hyphomonadaceae bacterium]